MVQITGNSNLNTILNKTSSDRVLTRGEDGNISGTSGNGVVARIKNKFSLDARLEYKQTKEAFARAVIQELGLDRPAFRGIRARMEAQLTDSKPLTRAKAQELFRQALFSAKEMTSSAGKLVVQKIDLKGPREHSDKLKGTSEDLRQDVQAVRRGLVENATNMNFNDLQLYNKALKDGQMSQVDVTTDFKQRFEVRSQRDLHKLASKDFSSAFKIYVASLDKNERTRLHDSLNALVKGQDHLTTAAAKMLLNAAGLDSKNANAFRSVLQGHAAVLKIRNEDERPDVDGKLEKKAVSTAVSNLMKGLGITDEQSLGKLDDPAFKKDASKYISSLTSGELNSFVSFLETVANDTEDPVQKQALNSVLALARSPMPIMEHVALNGSAVSKNGGVAKDFGAEMVARLGIETMDDLAKLEDKSFVADLRSFVNSLDKESRLSFRDGLKATLDNAESEVDKAAAQLLLDQAGMSTPHYETLRNVVLSGADIEFNREQKLDRKNAGQEDKFDGRIGGAGKYISNTLLGELGIKDEKDLSKLHDQDFKLDFGKFMSALDPSQAKMMVAGLEVARQNATSGVQMSALDSLLQLSRGYVN